MSRYSKTYGRKVNSSTAHQTSIQFDKLFCENSNRPSAAKSAGTVGKWGITSFTSIRSSGFTVGGRRDEYKSNNKRWHGGDVKPSPKEPLVELLPSAPTASPALPRPKKFFKSRNAAADPPVYRPAAPSTAPPSVQPSKKYTKPRTTVGARKMFVAEEQTEAMNLSNPAPTAAQVTPPAAIPPTPPINPPIVLRIFKGTSQILTPFPEDSCPPKPVAEDQENLSKEDEEEEEEDEEEEEEEESEEEQNVPADLSPVKSAVMDQDRENLLRVLEDDSTPEPEEAPTANVNTTEEPQQLGVIPAVVVEAPVPVQAEEPAGEQELEGVKHEVESSVVVGCDYSKGVEEWSSDSEGSDGIAERINSLTSEECKDEPVQLKERLPTKKGSIFKSRSVTGNKQRLALYKHKLFDDKDSSAKDEKSKASLAVTTTEGEFEQEQLTRVTSYPEPDMDEVDDFEAITSIRCTRQAKGFYTVVRNVKKAHQIQESGEFQEFNDDVEYILDALQDNNPIGTRCLSAITLASKCMVPAFRMHVRAHGTVAKFFRALHDATKDQSLGMCTATVMFVLSQDRLNMDVDRESLELMLNLLESDTSHTAALHDCGLSDGQLRKTRARVRQLCADIQSQGHAKHLNLDNITVGHLAMETLLSLTCRRAGEWFKEELRELGGLEHIVRTIVDCCRLVDMHATGFGPQVLESVRKVDRCLRVLENVTLQNEENYTYLLTYSDGVLVTTLVRLYRMCVSYLHLCDSTDKESSGTLLRECLSALLRVLINLTHDFNNKTHGSSLVCEKEGVIEATLHILLQAPKYVPDEHKFDLIVLALILLINFVEHSRPNRQRIVEAMVPLDPDSDAIFDKQGSCIEALVRLFYKEEELARREEEKTDAILEGEKPVAQEEKTNKTQEESIEETVTMLLQKAGRHMEHTLIGAYVTLLLGYLTMDNKEHEIYVRSYLPEGNFATMLATLSKFYHFMTLTVAAGSESSRGIKAMEMLIKHLTESDKEHVSNSQTLYNVHTTTLCDNMDTAMDLASHPPYT